MATVEFRSTLKSFPGRERPVVDNVSLAIDDGSFVILLGPSGCGKTTLLRMVAGLEDPDRGDILIDGVSALDRKPRERDFALVFQQYALYPHLTVEENIRYPLKVSSLSRAERERQVDWAAELMGIGDLRKRLPAELSGGEQQRVAIGRAIVRRPKLFLLDEPLSNLDVQTRLRLRAELRTLQREIGTTTIMVTHDQADAMAIADRIVVLNEGRIQQSGSPDDVYDRPDRSFVAGFLGSPPMNLLPAIVEGQELVIGGALRVAGPIEIAGKSRVIAGFRPEAVEIRTSPEPGWSPVLVELVEPLGSETILHLKIGTATALARTGPRIRPKPSTEIWARIDPQSVRLFDETTGVALA